MTINEYQTEALKTASGMNHDSEDDMLLNGVLGLTGEAGECADMVKKYRFQGHELDKEHMAKELGDVSWYIALAAHAIGYTLEDIFKMNIEKLRKRYPDGVFDVEHSLHRQEGDV
jgi:NTP pyrophosphatase (non-canonical NTP hydrolase)